MMPGTRVADWKSAAEAAVATTYQSVEVNGINIFYREAGPAHAPVLLLLHGYPSSSRMYEPLISRLLGHYRLIAPDYPGFGLSAAPERSVWPYSFSHLASAMLDFTDVLGLERFSLYLQDYGGPIGLRLALARPERVRALIIQNAVMHEEGLTAVWDLRRSYWGSHRLCAKHSRGNVLGGRRHRAARGRSPPSGTLQSGPVDG